MRVHAAIALALALPIEPLAKLTSGVTLLVFALANGALVVIQHRDPAPPGIFRAPRWVPAVGAIVSVGVVAFELAGQVAG